MCVCVCVCMFVGMCVCVCVCVYVCVCGGWVNVTRTFLRAIHSVAILILLPTNTEI